MAPQVWFITGASSGFGLATTKFLLAKGDAAIATLRNPAKSPELEELAKKYPSTLLVLPLDVTKPETIAPTFAKAVEKFGRIDVVFNNAGYGIAAETEAVPVDQARHMFETNFWGVALISVEAIKVFREINPKTGKIGGALITSSSLQLLEPYPAFSYYAATKAAATAFGESLKGELDPDWNISVTSIAFGYFYTKAFDNLIRPPVHPAYTKPDLVIHTARAFDDSIPGGASADDAANLVYKVVNDYEPKDRPAFMPLGMDAVGCTRRLSERRTGEADKWEFMSKGLVKDGSSGPLIS